ncbi:MAG: prepilin peptidase [bacterium]
MIENISPIWFYIAAFIFGSIIGSFINVLIYRLPLEMDVVFKPSFCPKCKTPIKWYHNIPILSYLYLRGRCAYCKGEISIQYPIVEFITAVSFLFFYMKFGLSWDFMILVLLYTISLPILVIDYKYRIIPDELSIGGAILGLIVSIFYTFKMPESNLFISNGLVDSFLGIVVGIMIFGGIYVVSFIVFRKEGIGLGDLKFACTIGAFLGLSSSVIAFFLSFIYGSLFGLIIMAIKRIKTRKKLKLLSSLNNLNFSSDYLSSIVRAYIYINEIDELKSSYIAFGPYMVLGMWTSMFLSGFIIEAFVGGEL